LSDAGIAALVDDPTSETKATLDTTYVRSVNGVLVDPETGNVEIEAGSGGTLVEDPSRPGVFIVSGGLLTEDPLRPGVFQIGA
jgi:hypothetical protein